MRPIVHLLPVILLTFGRLDAALLAHYKFDETAGAATALNQVPGASTGTIGNAVTSGLEGISGNAYRFNNNAIQAGVVDMGNASFFPAITASGALTFSAWVKTNDTTGGRNVAVFAGNDNVAASYVDLGHAAAQAGQLGSASGRLRPNANVNLSEIFSTPKVINDNAWHHLALTIELGAAPGNIVLYVDGVVAVTGNAAAAQFPAFNNFEIGRLGRAAPADPFDGLIDDVQVYDQALSASEVAYLHQHPGASLVPPAPPVVMEDSVTMHHLGAVLLDVLTNDETGVQPATVEIVTPPAGGSATPDARGRILYRHLTGAPATDNFTYRVKGASGLFSDPATVTVTFTSAPRIGNTTVNMPRTPPAVDFAVVDAFPGVSFTSPSTMESPPGDTKRLFVGERGGKIYVIPDVTAANLVKQLYLDLSAINLDDGNEQGLKGFAFHPRFAENGYIFVGYNHQEGGSEYFRLSRFKSTDPTGNTPVDPATEEMLLDQLFLPESGNQPRIHNINECNFGPDGYLYVGFGDGDGHPDPSNNSQRIDKNFHSSLARFDVDLEPEDYTTADGTGSDDASVAPNPHPAVVLHGGHALYEIPADNPFIGATSFNGLPVTPENVRTEFYAVGFRNPWQFTFDPVNGKLWLADVGLNTREEVNVITKGGNYGWAFLEGSVPTKGTPPPGAVLTGPVLEYGHGNGPFQGNSIIGGLVYRGSRHATLVGKYIFADYLSGNIWAMNADGETPVVQRIAGESGLVVFATDPSDSSLLMLDHGDGVVRRLTGTTSTGSFPLTLSETGVFADLASLTPNPGVVSYEPNLTFWSDHAVKRRWFVIKNTTDLFGYSPEGPWQSPQGAVFVKHFDMEMERGNPATRKRLETRLLVRTSTGTYGVSYRWNEQETDAVLVPDEGAAFHLDIIDHGTPVTQTWQIPSRSQCGTCHTAEGGHFLSLNTRQLNKPGTLGANNGNFLDLLQLAGYIEGLSQSPANLPRHVRPEETGYTLEARARSYLAVNCSYCHQSGGIGGGSFDLRAQLSLSSTGVVNGDTSSAGAPYKLVVPGHHGQSVIWNRMANANGFSRMPPLASSVIDETGKQLLLDWIDNKLPEHLSYDSWRLQYFGSLVSAEGEPGFDADHDGMTNRQEFLLNTYPKDGGSLWNAAFAVTESTVNIHIPENRKAWVERSTNLLDWNLWNIPGNDGMPVTGGTRSFPRETGETEGFYRLRVEEP